MDIGYCTGIYVKVTDICQTDMGGVPEAEKWLLGTSSFFNSDRWRISSQIFDPNLTYTECYGPEYHGLATITKWFDDWNTRGTVLVWTIKQFIHQGSMTAVEWYFKCEYESVLSLYII
jgi:hypothetical protein